MANYKNHIEAVQSLKWRCSGIISISTPKPVLPAETALAERHTRVNPVAGSWPVLVKKLQLIGSDGSGNREESS